MNSISNNMFNMYKVFGVDPNQGQNRGTGVSGVDKGISSPIAFGQLTQRPASIVPENAKQNYENGLAPGNQAGSIVNHNGKEGIAGKELYFTA